MHPRTRRRSQSLTWSLLLLAGLALGPAGEARAASYSVNPTLVFLKASARSALVTIKNETGQPLRFQLSMTAWTQSPAGMMQVTPTDDVVFFPALLTLERGEQRNVRVAAATTFGTIEKTYRLFIEELPSADRPGQPGTVRVLTRTGIPVFLAPAKPAVGAAITDIAVGAGRLTFTIRNTGNVHLLPEVVKVVGLGEQGSLIFEQEVKAWYVLAGGTLALEAALPRPQCSEIRTLQVTAESDTVPLVERLATPNGVCGGE